MTYVILSNLPHDEKIKKREENIFSIFFFFFWDNEKDHPEKRLFTFYVDGDDEYPGDADGRVPFLRVHEGGNERYLFLEKNLDEYGYGDRPNGNDDGHENRHCEGAGENEFQWGELRWLPEWAEKKGKIPAEAALPIWEKKAMNRQRGQCYKEPWCGMSLDCGGRE